MKNPPESSSFALRLAAGLLALCAAWLTAPAALAQKAPVPSDPLAGMSAMGRLAQRVAQARATQPGGGAGTSFHAGPKIGIPTDGGDEGDGEGPNGGQAELAIAVDATSQHIVVGYNDTRGFLLNPYQLSGVAYSDDGGVTFVDAGRLPTTNGTPNLVGQLASGVQLPQIYGDPDVKYVPGGNGLQFIYSSIMVVGLGTAPNFTNTAQTMSLHRSFDGGHTWQGPFEVTTATQPNNAGDAADKEFIDVDPDTGRVILSWSDFTSVVSGGAEISTTYSDNAMTGNPPTWSARSVLNPGATAFDTGSMPRFAGNGSPNVYVVWSRSSDVNMTSYGGWPYGNVLFARSADNGATWSAPLALAASDFFPIDQILGNDRVHMFPALAVDNSPGPNHGNIYVVYADNDNQDGADIVFQRSTNGGAAFSAPVRLNARPGNDRAQWFPAIAVDRDTGRVNVMFDDQGVAPSGDLMQMLWLYSDDGGVTWSKPSPLTSRPFHAGYGNDTGQPNLGDYNMITAQGGAVFAAFATTPESSPFTNGQPDTRFTYPSFLPGLNPVGFKKTTSAQAALDLGPVSFTQSSGGGFIVPGDTVTFWLPLRNYVTNPVLNPAAYTGISATLASSTPGVTVSAATESYPDAAPGATVTHAVAFQVQIAPGFVAGTVIEFSLTVTTAQGSTTLLFGQPTGAPVATTIFASNFHTNTPGAMPTGWTAAHGGGNNTVPWTTRTNVPGAVGTNVLFHINANDGTTTYPYNTRWERAYSPSVVIPANVSYVTLDFDIWYNTEDDPDFNTLAYDGLTLRFTDLTPGRTLRSCLAEAFAEEFVTGNQPHFPKHLPRFSNSAYLEDMSVWGGLSGGWKHVRMKLPGMAGSTVQLRWEFTQDPGSTGLDVHPGTTLAGVAVDNIVMQSVVNAAPPIARPDLMGTYQDLPASAPAAKLLANDTSVSGGPLTLTGVSPTSAQGGTVTLSGGMANYTPPAGFSGDDQFTYTVSDGTTSAQGIVTVRVIPVSAPPANQPTVKPMSGGNLVQFHAIPGRQYLIQWAAALTGPWTNLSPALVADPTGLAQFQDTSTPPPPTRFYRLVVAP